MMERPHNAVLLLCSSHDKGCCPYMCGTSFPHSNCLDQYKKADTKVMSSNNTPIYDVSTEAMDPLSGRLVVNDKVTELTSPLCRGQVKGWTVVEPARDHLNAKKRTCNQDNCSFIGTYKELQKHVFDSETRQNDRGSSHTPRSSHGNPIASFHELDQDGNHIDENEVSGRNHMTWASRLRRRGRVILGRSGRKRRPREGNNEHSV